MAAAAFIDDAVATLSPDAPVSCKPYVETLLLDAEEEEEETTDAGHTSASEAESSSGSSSHEGCRSSGRRCRFGKTSLETIPATPAASAAPMTSPPGLSRAAMREARDACTQQEEAASTSHATSGTRSRFGATHFGTVPKTPVGKAKLKNLKSIFGSPPGLSHTERRRERDACMAPALWGNSEVLATTAAGKASAQSKLARTKENAALLKDFQNSQKREKSRNIQEEDDATMSDTSEAEATPEKSFEAGQTCRFNGTTLGTMPSTPASGQNASPASPPGLSRKAMRQSRDAVVKATALASNSWGNRKSESLTFTPAGKPMTPPAERAAKQRAARDAMTLGWDASMSSAPKVLEMPR